MENIEGEKHRQERFQLVLPESQRQAIQRKHKPKPRLGHSFPIGLVSVASATAEQETLLSDDQYDIRRATPKILDVKIFRLDLE